MTYSSIFIDLMNIEWKHFLLSYLRNEWHNFFHHNSLHCDMLLLLMFIYFKSVATIFYASYIRIDELPRDIVKCLKINLVLIQQSRCEVGVETFAREVSDTTLRLKYTRFAFNSSLHIHMCCFPCMIYSLHFIFCEMSRKYCQ